MSGEDLGILIFFSILFIGLLLLLLGIWKRKTLLGKIFIIVAIILILLSFIF